MRLGCLGYCARDATMQWFHTPGIGGSETNREIVSCLCVCLCVWVGVSVCTCARMSCGCNVKSDGIAGILSFALPFWVFRHFPCPFGHWVSLFFFDVNVMSIEFQYD